MIVREDGKVLCNKFQLADGRSAPTYVDVADGDRAHAGPWDEDRERYLRPGETFQRLRGTTPRVYEGRVWTTPERAGIAQ